MTNYCECAFPAPYHTEGRCGRCFKRIEPEPAYCPTCEGEGRVLADASIHSTALRPSIVECPTCHGHGELPI